MGAKPIPGEKDTQGNPKIRYFWGAKHAAFVEPTAYGPAFVYEEVFTAKTSDVKTALPTLKPLVGQWAYRLKKFLADAAYDAFEIYQYVYAKDTSDATREPATAYIALNTRGHKRLNRQFSENGNLICEASLEMTNGGRWFDKHKGYHRQKFTCPLVDQKTKHTCDTCPINHETFPDNSWSTGGLPLQTECERSLYENVQCLFSGGLQSHSLSSLATHATAVSLDLCVPHSTFQRGGISS